MIRISRKMDASRFVRELLYFLPLLYYELNGAMSQDYDVSDIQCAFWGENARTSKVAAPVATPTAVAGVGASASYKDMLSARLRKPEGFKGNPLFADDRTVDPLTDPACQIRPDLTDVTRLTFNLLVNDFNRCGVLKRNDFVHVRIWFPQFPGVVMMSDQELIIMCKPPEPTVIENKAAGFAGSFPHGARVSGVVEETPGRLEYEVALYKEAPTRLANLTSSELPVDQAVPIGTKLQLRARINPHSAWKFVKLMEVTVSPDPDDPHVSGSVPLVKEGCRNRDFATIIPHQPARYRDRHNEVFLDFEAFLLSTMKERSTLWIHSQIKACMDLGDCQPEYCLDLYEPSGQGRRRRRDVSSNNSADSAISTQSAKFQENIEYTVIMPADIYHAEVSSEWTCQKFVITSSVLGCALLVCAFITCYLACRLQSALTSNYRQPNMDQMARERSHKLSLGHHGTPGYAGRTTLQ